ncbi:MAG: CDP-glucose 4,6-dehydratase [Promethearchaeota archaeon]
MIEYFNNFFNGKKVLITGHTGFIGSWLAIILNELSANVIGYALPPYTNKDNFVVTNLAEKITHTIGDIRDFDKVKSTFKIYKPDVVVHLAAQPIVRKSYKIPRETYEVNVGGTLNIFEAFRISESSRVLINFTTDKVYENLEINRGYNENDKLGGYDPYSSSKACSELITSAYRSSYFNPKNEHNNKLISSIRCGNVIGGGDWQEDRLIPDCMKAILADREIVIRNPGNIRPWQYVLEPIRGLLTLIVKMWEGDPLFSNAWNFGPDDNQIFTVNDIIIKIINFLGKGKYKNSLNSHFEDLHETKTLILDSSKAKDYLGWKNELSINDTIEYLCQWYMEEDVNYEFDVKQINNYFNNIR